MDFKRHCRRAKIIMVFIGISALFSCSKNMVVFSSSLDKLDKTGSTIIVNKGRFLYFPCSYGDINSFNEYYRRGVLTNNGTSNKFLIDSLALELQAVEKNDSIMPYTELVLLDANDNFFWSDVTEVFLNGIKLTSGGGGHYLTTEWQNSNEISINIGLNEVTSQIDIDTNNNFTIYAKLNLNRNKLLVQRYILQDISLDNELSMGFIRVTEKLNLNSKEYSDTLIIIEDKIKIKELVSKKDFFWFKNGKIH